MHTRARKRVGSPLWQPALTNPERATALYKEAAANRQRTFEFIPYQYKDRVYAIRPGIKGVHLWTGYFTISFKDVRVS